MPWSRPACAAKLLLAVTLALGSCARPEEAAQEVAVEQAESRYLSPQDSLRWLGHLKGASQDTTLAWLLLGARYLEAGYPDSAGRYFEEALARDPDRGVTRLNLGVAHARAGRYDEARDAFRRFVEKDPGGVLTQEIFRIIDKFDSMDSEREKP